MIYFLRLKTGAIKIGFTGNLKGRMANHKGRYGKDIILLATMPGDAATETEIHERFRSLRFLGTEQFRPGQELMEFLGRPDLAVGDPTTVKACDEKPIRVHPDVHKMAQRVADYRGENLGDYLSNLARPTVTSDYRKMVVEEDTKEAKS